MIRPTAFVLTLLLSAGAAMVQTASAQSAGADQQAATPSQPPAQGQRRPMMDMKQLDTNNDGAISRDEFLAGHRGADDFSALDRNHDGSIAAEEFEKFGETRREARFHQLDTNGDGKLTQDEWDKRTAAMFDHMDRNKDGRITQDEMMQGRMKK